MKFSATGEYLASYGSGVFEGPSGVAIDNSTGIVYVSNSTAKDIVELNGNGEKIGAFGQQGELGRPVDLTVDSQGDVFVADAGSSEVEEFSASGVFIRAIGEGHLQEPVGVAISEGMLYVTSAAGGEDVSQFTLSGAYRGSFGGPGTASGEFERPLGIAVSPNTGDLLIADSGNDRVQEFTPAGKFLTEFGWSGEKAGQFREPVGVAVAGSGAVYVDDHADDWVQEFTPPEAGGVHMVYSTQWGSQGSGEGQFNHPSAPVVDAGNGDVWVTDFNNDRVQQFSPQGKFLGSYGTAGSGEGQFDGPAGITINQATGDGYVADFYNDRIDELGPKGEFIRSFGKAGAEPGQLSQPTGVALSSTGDVWVADRGNDRIQEFSATGSFIAAYGSQGKGNGQFEEPTSLVLSGEDLYVVDTGNDRVQELSQTGQYLGQVGSEGDSGGQLKRPTAIAINQAGDLFVLDSANSRIDEYNPAGHFMQSIASHGSGEGQLNEPQGIALTPAGDIYITDTANNRIEKWAPNTQAVHDTSTIYYTPGTQASVQACQDKPQWSGLPCRTEPVAQPTDSAAEPKGEQLPELPVVTTEYNMWYEPVKKTEAFGATTRTKTIVYEGERPVSESTQAGGSDAAVPPVSFKYSATLGMLVEQTSEGETITRQLNTLGQLASYTDAAGNTTAYSYDQYERPVEVIYDASKLDHMEARQTLHYDEATGAVTELQDLGGEGTYGGQGAGAFKATYDVEGNILSEHYPNDMTAIYAYNSIGEGVALQYVKDSHCTGAECEWFKDTLTPSIHGEPLSQQSTLATVQYRYQQPGGLTEVRETPTGEGCTTRVYAYNEEANRTSLTTRKPGAEGKCASEGGETERHTYDEGNRLTDEELQYEPLGNITRVPAVDAGGHILETEYYANGQVRSQTQDQKTNTYTLDPEGRTLSTETVGKELASAVVISHYDGSDSGTPSWTYNQTTGTWTRNIVSFGGLAAVEESGKQAVLQIRDLEGNIIGTANLSESESKPRTLERTTAFGVPTTENPTDQYGWLGASGLSSNLSSGSIVQDGVTYVPQLGAPLQTTSPELPAAPLSAVTPVVITVAPFVPVKYVEASSQAGEAETPSGNLPEPEGEEPYDASDPEFRDYKHGVHFNVDARILSMSNKTAVVSFRVFANTPGIRHKQVEYLRINVKRFVAGRIENVLHDETEYKTSLAAMTFDAPVTADELWIFELVSVVRGATRDYSIVTKLVEGEIVLAGP